MSASPTSDAAAGRRRSRTARRLVGLGAREDGALEVAGDLLVALLALVRGPPGGADLLGEPAAEDGLVVADDRIGGRLLGLGRLAGDGHAAHRTAGIGCRRGRGGRGLSE